MADKTDGHSYSLSAIQWLNGAKAQRLNGLTLLLLIDINFSGWVQALSGKI